MDFHNTLWEQFRVTSPSPSQAQIIHSAWKDVPPPIDTRVTNFEEFNNQNRTQYVEISVEQMKKVLDTLGLLSTDFAPTVHRWLDVFDLDVARLRTPIGRDVWLSTTTHTPSTLKGYRT